MSPGPVGEPYHAAAAGESGPPSRSVAALAGVKWVAVPNPPATTGSRTKLSPSAAWWFSVVVAGLEVDRPVGGADQAAA